MRPGHDGHRPQAQRGGDGAGGGARQGRWEVGSVEGAFCGPPGCPVVGRGARAAGARKAERVNSHGWHDAAGRAQCLRAACLFRPPPKGFGRGSGPCLIYRILKCKTARHHCCFPPFLPCAQTTDCGCSNSMGGGVPIMLLYMYIAYVPPAPLPPLSRLWAWLWTTAAPSRWTTTAAPACRACGRWGTSPTASTSRRVGAAAGERWRNGGKEAGRGLKDRGARHGAGT